jgi:uncharacterized protein
MLKYAGRHRLRGRLASAFARPPFYDEKGLKGWFGKISRAQRHLVRHFRLEIAGWPQWQRPLRVIFLADFHTGSHLGDVARLDSIMAEAARLTPDLVLFGGDYVNMQLFGGGRVPPWAIASILSRINAPLGRFAILGNHDYDYDERAVADALRDSGITVLEYERHSARYLDHSIQIAGIPDARITKPEAYTLLADLSPNMPAIVFAHDPVWFRHLPAGPYLMLAGHTHGGQIQLPGIGIVRKATKAPRRWCHGLVKERDQYLYVTS